MAMLKNSDHPRLHTTYDKICDDIDGDKDLTFDMVQKTCATSSGAAANPPPLASATP